MEATKDGCSPPARPWAFPAGPPDPTLAGVETTARQAASPERSLRQSATPLALVRTAIGGPRELGGKLSRLLRTVRLWLRPGEVRGRLEQLRRAGLVDELPGRAQIFFGGLDMLRFVIEPFAREYYQKKGISFGFHTLLRVLDDPVSMIDPTGFLSDRDTIIGHVMQVVHLNPIYDLQLMEMFPGGLDEFERQVAAMVDGSHPRHRTISAIVEEPDYHARLLDYVRRYRRDHHAPPIRREQGELRSDPHAAAAERTFATLPGFLRYCRRLPPGGWASLRRLRQVERFPLEWSEPGPSPV
jgi:hypothetical protein